jgi:hypothetical protein
MIVLAIIGSVAKKQLQAVRALPSVPTAIVVPERDAAGVAASAREGGRLDAFPGAVAADPNGLTVPQQSQNLQRQVANQVQQQLQKGAARAGEGP